jgi:predicted ATP-grasp superfamily ATP-dependent carboligase
MQPGDHLLLFGASTRAAAFSALRAGLSPWCADLFADADLRRVCPASAIAAAEYPDALLEMSARAPAGPWMYVGGLENRPALVEALARSRPLWGNGAEVLRRVRDPETLAAVLTEAGLPCPQVRPRADDLPPGRWLVKPRDSAGGRGISFLQAGSAPGRHTYLQEHIDGAAWSAVYVGREGGALLLGATRQLVGESWLHAAAFHYCGSLGPLPLASLTRDLLRRLGDLLVTAFGLRGLFGVDFVLRDGKPWPVEVNPRYPASVEVLEYTAGFAALALHRAVFDPGAPCPDPVPAARPVLLGKAVLFAAQALTFPADGPWLETLHQPPQAAAPAFADIPAAGQRIEKGRPVLTLFTTGRSPGEVLTQLAQTAVALDQRLAGT